jgi:hypothetical protein
MWTVLREILGILNESAVYLLVGFALAGVLHVVLRRTPGFTNLLATRGGKSVLLAALLGAPLPLCSCSVVPAGLTLRKKGASKGATVSFLISAPETDVTSILLTYGLLGPVMAVFRPLAAVITAVAAGLATNVVDRWAPDQAQPDQGSQDNRRGADEDEYHAARGPLWNALHYGFVRFFDDIIGWLFLGIILGGLITTVLPRLGIEQLPGGSLVAMPAMLLLGIPMYVCATASTPIAVGLIAGGVSPGAALVFLLAGPATNLGSLLALRKYLGRAVIVTYLCSIAVVSVLMGLWLDAAFDRTVIKSAMLGPATTEGGVGPIRIGGSIILLVLTYLSFRRTGLLTATEQRLAAAVGLRPGSPAVRVLAVAFLLAAYLGSGFFVVGPGERGVETRFGRIAAADLAPGLHYRWPYPIGAADVESVAKVRSIELGFRRPAPPRDLMGVTEEPAAADLAAESRMLTGREDIIDIKWVVQYRLNDAAADFRDYVYGQSDPILLIRDAADAAVRVATGRRSIDTLLTTDRDDVEDAVRQSLQAMLDECRVGVHVVQVCLVAVHAPPEVHWAFRDVASAAEDQMRTINQAYEYAERVVPEAEGGASQRVASARGKAVEIVQHAWGRTAAFADRLAAYREGPAVTRLRLYFERLDRVLPGLKKYICLSEALGRQVDLWFVKGGKPIRELPTAPGVDKETGP